MRIIAGTRRGMKLFAPVGNSSRPITDRVKESLFNVLFYYGLPDKAIVADLFCGVGSLGLEALSRGARYAAFVEVDRKILAVLERNIGKADFASNSKIIRTDAFISGAPIDKAVGKYTLVFVDPPYILSHDTGQDSALAKLMQLLSVQVLQNALVIVRTHENVTPLDSYNNFYLADRRSWGTMTVSIFRNKIDE